MPEVTSPMLLDLIKRSGLVEDEKLRVALDKIAADCGGLLPEDQTELCKRLVDLGLLTDWQTEKLLAGRHRGFRLGKYKLLKQIGKGGMSSVYLAEHLLMRRRVAIKVLPKNRVADKSYLERFQQEARAVAKLDDPNIVRAFDIDNDGDTHYIVMEYVEGMDLHQMVAAQGPLDYETAADHIAQVASGLQHAHEMGLVHRDIKPANCLIDKHKTVKLLDMGLAKMNDDETSLTLANDENVLGTADYLAPEQALNSHGADARSDIYSLGCTLYFLLCGRPPFPEGSISERLLKHQVEDPEGILKFRPDAPLSLVDLCNRMMSKKPENRPQTAGEVAETLTKWLAERGRKIGGGRMTPTEPHDSGVGSGILSRFQIAPPTVPGRNIPTAASSETLSAGDRDTKKIFGPDSGGSMEDDIGLAPLEEEAPKQQPPRKTGSSSNVLAEDKVGKPQSSARMKSSRSGPQKSIFEEELFKPEHDDPIRRRAAMKADYDPLHPPGYVAPHTKTPVGLWLGLGLVGLIVVIGLVMLLSPG
jgi:serine/threonine-protein kinase